MQELNQAKCQMKYTKEKPRERIRTEQISPPMAAMMIIVLHRTEKDSGRKNVQVTPGKSFYCLKMSRASS